MSGPTAERRLEMLGEFAEMAHSLARDLHQAALAAEDIDEKVRLTDGFHRMGRALRQSLALHARLERDARREAATDAEDAETLSEAHRARRKARVRAEIERLIWTEYEPHDFEARTLNDRLTRLLDAEAETEAFEAEDPDIIIERLCEALGFVIEDDGRSSGDTGAPEHRDTG